MRAPADRPAPPGLQRSRERTDPDELARLTRHSHIFASAVREILEVKLLRQTTSLPLTIPQFHLLRLMTYNGAHQVGQVADFLGVSAPAATKNVDKLERLGLLTRSPSRGDRRATLLSVNPTGRALVRRYDRFMRARLGAALRGFDGEDVARLTALLERFFLALLRSEVEAEEGADGFCLRCAAYLETGCPVGRLRGGCPYEESCGPRRPSRAVEGTP